RSAYTAPRALHSFPTRRSSDLMRMAGGRGLTAADLLNTWPVERLAQGFAELADERRAKRLAQVIVKRRGNAPFVTSDDLVNAIRSEEHTSELQSRGQLVCRLLL